MGLIRHDRAALLPSAVETGWVHLSSCRLPQSAILQLHTCLLNSGVIVSQHKVRRPRSSVKQRPDRGRDACSTHPSAPQGPKHDWGTDPNPNTARSLPQNGPRHPQTGLLLARRSVAARSHLGELRTFSWRFVALVV